MKDKILETVITRCAETIARALRAYSGERLGCRIYIETRVKDHEGGDCYGIKVRYKPSQTVAIDVNNVIQYEDQEDGTELIRRTEEADDFQI